MEMAFLIMEKSWNCVFEFLWEPCQDFATSECYIVVSFLTFLLLFKKLLYLINKCLLILILNFIVLLMRCHMINYCKLLPFCVCFIWQFCNIVSSDILKEIIICNSQVFFDL